MSRIDGDHIARLPSGSVVAVYYSTIWLTTDISKPKQNEWEHIYRFQQYSHA